MHLLHGRGGLHLLHGRGGLHLLQELGRQVAQVSGIRQRMEE